MRLIDADKLFKELLDKKDRANCAVPTSWQDGYISAMDVARMLVDAQETVDAKMIIHAKWEQAEGFEEGTRHSCSNCNEYAPSYSSPKEVRKYDEYEDLSNYCPHCGAKMSL